MPLPDNYAEAQQDARSDLEIRLWHDDVRPVPDRKSGWVWARTNEQAMEILRTGRVVEISLDHDLGYHDVEIPDDPDELAEVIFLRGQAEETGLDLVHWMIEHDLVPERVTIHSWNPDGARYMAARLNRHGYDCVIAPFTLL